MQTEEPFWLSEAYSDAINTQDIGLIYRNKVFSEIVTALFSLCGFNKTKPYLDYGGGYGMFVRMMRDSGYNFYWSDKFCENVYATKFSVFEPFREQNRFETATAFEVFEHLTDPIAEVEKLLSVTDSILFSTELIPENIEGWWYIMPEHGQHISFYSKDTLQFLAKKYGLNLYTNNKTLHLLTKKRISKWGFSLASSLRFARIYNTFFSPKSLLQEDYEQYLNK